MKQQEFRFIAQTLLLMATHDVTTDAQTCAITAQWATKRVSSVPGVGLSQAKKNT